MSHEPAGGLPVTEALGIARQIVDALEAAHEQGIIHRDLKPANVKVRPDGTVKVLDFGLAKLTQASGSGLQAPDGLSQSPTITTPAMTGMGMILGTAAYMSPEQARGRTVDKRTDIWAFGVVLYEMLTGRRVFEGEDVSLTLAAVMKSEPDLGALPSDCPPPCAPAWDDACTRTPGNVSATSATCVWCWRARSRRPQFQRELSLRPLPDRCGAGCCRRQLPQCSPVCSLGSSSGAPGRPSLGSSRGSSTYRLASSSSLVASVRSSQPLDGSGNATQVTELNGQVHMDSWTPDGRMLAAHHHSLTANASVELLLFPSGADSSPQPFLTGPARQADVVFSPDGRYAAYVDSLSGQAEVLIRPFPGPGPPTPVSVGGGREPAWARNGELFYRRPGDDAMMVVAVATSPQLSVGPPRELFRGSGNPGGSTRATYAVTADGQRFLDERRSGRVRPEQERRRPPQDQHRAELG